jgi:hypothetical protein
MSQTYRHVGSRTVRVASGDYEPGDTGLVLTDDEARRLQDMGAVQAEDAKGATSAPSTSNRAAIDREHAREEE